jgi:hypothetical protein
LATDSLVLKKNDNINLPEPKSRLFINNKLITSHNITTLTQAFHSIRVQQYFTKTYSWSNSLHEQVWWSIHGRALAGISIKKRTIIQKFIRDRKYYTLIKHLDADHVITRMSVSCTTLQEMFESSQNTKKIYGWVIIIL